MSQFQHALRHINHIPVPKTIKGYSGLMERASEAMQCLYRGSGADLGHQLLIYAATPFPDSRIFYEPAPLLRLAVEGNALLLVDA